MPYALLSDRNACAARNYAGKQQYFADKFQAWKAKNPKRYAYLGQRHTCKQRGVLFDIGFKDWVEWWGEDFCKRGKKSTDLCMCRYGDSGSYRLGNIYKATNLENKAGARIKDEGLHEDIPY